MIKKLLSFLVIIVFCGCDSKDEIKCLSFSYSTSVDFHVFNTQGEDLLDPATPNHLDVSKIKMFYVVNGITKEYYNPGLVFSRGFRVFAPELGGPYKIRIEMNTLDKSEKTISYIQWNETDRDTLESTTEVGDCYAKVKQVWLNGNLVWDLDMDYRFYPIIRK